MANSGCLFVMRNGPPGSSHTRRVALSARGTALSGWESRLSSSDSGCSYCSPQARGLEDLRARWGPRALSA